MNQKQVIEHLLKARNNGQWPMSSALGNAGLNRPQLPQPEMNKAIELWLKDDDPTGIQQMCDMLHLTGALTSTEYEQIMKAIDGEK